MAADAVGLHDPLLTFGNIDPFRRPAGIIDRNIPQPIDGFPDVIDAYVFVGQVTVHTLDGAVGTHVEPGLVIGLHGVAGGAEERRLCLGHEIRRPETEKQAGPGAENAQEKHPDENLPPVLVQSAHFLKNLTGISISPERRGRRSEKKILGEAKKELFVRRDSS
jgi:hypothetical protein